MERSALISKGFELPGEAGEETFEPKLHASLTKDQGGGFEVTDESGRTSAYNPQGRLTEVKTGEFSALKYDWEGGKLSEIAVEDPGATTSKPDEVAEREGGETEGQPEYQSSFGIRGVEEGQFIGPSGMALDGSGDLWVADSGNDRVEKYSPEGEYLASLGGSGSGEGKLLDPAAVAVDASGNVWVADAGNSRVEEFGPGGSFIRDLGSAGTGEGQFSGAGPQGIAIDAGGSILVTDPGGHRIEKFDSSGKFTEALGSSSLSEPSGLAVGPGGRIWVADASGDKVVAFEEGGQLLRSFGEEGEAEGELKGPSAVAVSAEGKVFVADTGNGRVQEFSEAGSFLHEFGSREGIKGRFGAPMGLAADREGEVWVAAVANPPETVEEAGEEEVETEAESPREGLVASYSFDEGAGKTAHDDSAHGHDGTISGGAWSAGRFDGALQLSGGSEECVTIPDSPELALSDEFTLLAWIKPEGEDPSEPVIFKESGWYFTYALYPGGLHAGMHPEGAGAYYPYSANEVAGSEELPANTWSNVALTYGNEELRLYVDGELVGSTESWGVILSEEPLRIGCAPKWEDGFTGRLDNIRLYDRALGGAEIGEDEEAAVKPLAARGPVASYSFDENAGKTAHDDTGDGHEGAIEGGEWAEGKFGSALHLDGAEEDCMSVADSPELQLTHEFTLSAWVRPEGGDQSGPIFFKESEHFVSYAMYLGFSEEGKPAGVVAPEPYEAVSVEGSSPLPQDAWSQLTLTYDTDRLRLYVNGTLVSSEAISGPVESEQPLRIGCSRDWEEGFTGRIDNARIYDRALPPAEIEHDQETAVAPLPPEPPVASYSFDEGEGEVAHDSSGNGHDGTIEGIGWAAGRFGNALKFEAGHEGCLTIPDATQLQLRGEFTLEAWVKPEGDGPVIFKEAEHFVSYELSMWGFEPEGDLAPQPYELAETEGSDAVAEGAWSELALTYDGEMLRLYANGKLIGSKATTRAVESDGPLRIGCSRDWEQNFTGSIDEVRLYDRTLNAQQLSEDRSTPVSSETDEATRYQIEKWKTTSETPIAAPEDDPHLQVGYQLSLVSSVEGEQIPTQSYEHEGDLLTAHENEAGEKAEYEYDEDKRLTAITLPDGTTAHVEYEASVGRVKAVTVQLAGKSAKTTNFTYQDEPRETTVSPPEGEPLIHYQIGEDGSIFKWSNAPQPPEIEPLNGSLYTQRGEVHPDPISPGDQNLEVKAYSAEGIASIQVIANGDQLVEEETCDTKEPNNECDKTQVLELVTDTEAWQPGILWLEILVTDAQGQKESERFWDNIPNPPPSEGEAPQPPTFEDIKRFREEFGLDLDLNGKMLARNERIFELINDWHRPGTYLGNVARSSWERWGVPLRPADVAELEYREAYVEADVPSIEAWAASHYPATYAGIEVDQGAGGIIRIGFIEEASQSLEELKHSLALMASDRIQLLQPDPTRPVLAAETREEEVNGLAITDPQLSEEVTGLQIADSTNLVLVETKDVTGTEGRLRELLGSLAGIGVIYEPNYDELLSTRNRQGGRMLAGDTIWTDWEPEASHPLFTRATAGFGALEKTWIRSEKRWLVTRYLLSAGHAGRVGTFMYRIASPSAAELATRANKEKIGRVGRDPYSEGSKSVDALAMRFNSDGLTPMRIYGNGGRRPDIGPAAAAFKGENLCFSGARSGHVKCLKAVRLVHVFSDREHRGIGVIFCKAPGTNGSSLPGDSGAPVWDPRTGRAIGIMEGRNLKHPERVYVQPLVTTSWNRRIVGALDASVMGSGSLHVIHGG